MRINISRVNPNWSVLPTHYYHLDMPLDELNNWIWNDAHSLFYLLFISIPQFSSISFNLSIVSLRSLICFCCCCSSHLFWISRIQFRKIAQSKNPHPQNVFVSFSLSFYIVPVKLGFLRDEKRISSIPKMRSHTLNHWKAYRTKSKYSTEFLLSI